MPATTAVEEPLHLQEVPVETRLFHISDSEGVCGQIAWRMTHERTTRGNIAYEINPAKRGRGYATRALQALLRDVITPRGFNGVQVCCDADNEASQKVIYRAGGEYEYASIDPMAGKKTLSFWIAIDSQP